MKFSLLQEIIHLFSVFYIGKFPVCFSRLNNDPADNFLALVGNFPEIFRKNTEKKTD